MVRLGDVAQVIRGVTFKPDQVMREGGVGAVACLRTKNIQQTLDTADLIFVPESVVKNPAQFVLPGDTVISSANSWNLVGKCAWVDQLNYRAAIGGFIVLLRATSAIVDARYLYRWFSSPRVQAVVRSFGQQTTNISNLNVGRTLDLEIPLPPVPEQRRIAAILDRADELRAKRRRTLTLLDELAGSIFSEMFGSTAIANESSRAASLGSHIESYQNGLYKPKTDYGSGIEILRINDYSNGAVGPFLVSNRVDVTSDEIDRFSLSENDIVINRVNALSHVGKAALVGRRPEPLIFESNMMRLQLRSSTLLPGFLIRWLQTKEARNQFTSSAKQAINQASINQSDVAGLKLWVPSLADQQRFVEMIDSITNERDLATKAVVHLDELFASLQHRAFRREL